MANFFNIKGTTYPSFNIGKNGRTILQGVAAPNGTDGGDGDLYLLADGTNSAAYTKIDSTWYKLLSENNEINDLGDVNITSATINQVIKFDGTNWINGEGGDSLDSLFNSSNSVGDETDLNSTALTNAYQYTGTGRAVVTSIHVTNVDGTNEAEIGVLVNDASGTADYYIAKDMPVPETTSLEVLRRPKVLEQNDRIKLQANAADDLEVIITIAPYDSNTSLFNAHYSAGSSAASSAQAVYTETNDSGSMIESILVANDQTGTEGCQVDIIINDGTTDFYLTRLMNVPPKASVELCEGPRFLPDNGVIKVKVSDADRVDISVAGRKL